MFSVSVSSRFEDLAKLCSADKLRIHQQSRVVRAILASYGSDSSEFIHKFVCISHQKVEQDHQY